jgi:hypothetical protein
MPHTPPVWAGGAPWGIAQLSADDVKRQRRVQGLDLLAFLGTAALLGSLFMPWYQISESFDGLSVSLSLTPLGQHAGGLRWAMLVLSIATLVELAVTALIFRFHSRDAWPHRSLLALLCLVNLAVVIWAMVASPFAEALGAFNGTSLGPGAYLAIVAALLATGAAIARLVTGPPAMSR